MLEHSREFKVLAVHLNFTIAARKLNMSQSCLSRHISDLERDLGFKLFARNPVALTSAGKQYMESINDIIHSFDQLVDRCRQLERDELRSTIIISSVPWEGPTMNSIYERIVRFRDNTPDFHPQFSTNRSLGVREMAESGEADIGLLYDEVFDPPGGFVCERMFDRHFSAWVHKNNPLLNRPQLTLADFADSFLISSANQQFSTWLDGMLAACRKFDMMPKVRLKELNKKADFLLSINTDEFVLLPTDGDNLKEYNANLVEVPFDDSECFYTTYFYYDTQSSNQNVLRFVDCCRQLW